MRTTSPKDTREDLVSEGLTHGECDDFLYVGVRYTYPSSAEKGIKKAADYLSNGWTGCKAKNLQKKLKKKPQIWIEDYLCQQLLVQTCYQSKRN